MKKFLKRYFALLVLVITGTVFAAPTNWSTNREKSKVVISQTGMEFTSDGTPSGEKVMQINTGGRVVSFGPFSVLSGNTSITIENTGTTINLGVPTDVVGPVISPISYVPGMGAFPIMVTKGWNFFIGEPGQNTQMFLSNADTSFTTIFQQSKDQPRLHIALTSGSIMSETATWEFGGDGKIQAGTDISSIISDDKDFVTKKYVDDNMSVLGDYVTLSTSQTITGNKVFTGGTELRGALLARLDWMGSENSGWSMDENGIEYVGYSCSDFGASSLMNKSCITALVTGYNSNLSNTYVPYRSGNKFYDSNTIFNYTLGRLELGGRSGVINYSGVAMIASGGAYFDGGEILGGFSIPVGSGAGMFGFASGTGKYAGYLQTSSNAYGLGIDANGTSTAGIFTSMFGTILDLTTLNGTGISINKIFSTYTGGIALNIGYDNASNMSVDYSGNISTVGNQTFNNGVNTPFRFAYSGGLMEGQYFTGGVRVSAMVYTMP